MNKYTIAILLLLAIPAFSQLPGDLNCNGVVTGSDLTYLDPPYYCDRLMECTIENGDLDGDNLSLTVSDYLLLYYYFFGIIPPDFPYNAESDTLLLESSSAFPGDNLALPIYLKTIDTLTAFQFYILADSDYITLDSVELIQGFPQRTIDCWQGIQILSFNYIDTIMLLPGDYNIGDIYASVNPGIDQPTTTYIEFSEDLQYAFHTGLANLTFFQPVLVNSEIQIIPTGISSDEAVNLPISTTIKAYPNPFNSILKIIATCPIESELVIYDLLGRAVKTFPVNRGENSLTWDATDDNGKSVGTGIYFIRVKGSATSQVEKILFLK